ncbi:MAG: hypothetical protein L0387_38350 [Acidobacteria bacterium]|nr:hypothetical protein [Acidobacteriota bacterium]
MRQPFYLMRTPLAEIEKIAREEVAPPDFDTFVDGLDKLKVSDELKEWMKRTGSATTQGDRFISSLTTDDVMDVPEFRNAYVTRNLIMVGLGFPKRKAKATDRENNPAKWEESEKQFWSAVRNYLTLHPDSKQHMDEHLLDLTADIEWRSEQARHEERVRQHAQQLLYTRYLVAQTETNYDGFARLSNLPAGRFWLSTLWQEARAGDVRLRWELPVELQPAETVSLRLNNANAAIGER